MADHKDYLSDRFEQRQLNYETHRINTQEEEEEEESCDNSDSDMVFTFLSPWKKPEVANWPKKKRRNSCFPNGDPEGERCP